jgi:lipopolysaccharide transport system permease protein
LQLVFLLSPILFKREALGSVQWVSALNPLYIVLDQFRTAVISGRISWHVNAVIFLVNSIGFVVAVYLLDRNRKSLPFLF